MISFDPNKQASNLDMHGIDLTIAEEVLWGFTITREDTRLAYGETRLQTLGEYNGHMVVVVHTPRTNTQGVEVDHIISIRKAERHEARYYWQNHPGS